MFRFHIHRFIKTLKFFLISIHPMFIPRRAVNLPDVLKVFQYILCLGSLFEPLCVALSFWFQYIMFRFHGEYRQRFIRWPISIHLCLGSPYSLTITSYNIFHSIHPMLGSTSFVVRLLFWQHYFNHPMFRFRNHYAESIHHQLDFNTSCLGSTAGTPKSSSPSAFLHPMFRFHTCTY